MAWVVGNSGGGARDAAAGEISFDIAAALVVAYFFIAAFAAKATLSAFKLKYAKIRKVSNRACQGIITDLWIALAIRRRQFY